MRLGETKLIAERQDAPGAVPAVLAVEFNEQWPRRAASADQPKRDSLEERARSAEEVWFIGTRMSNAATTMETPFGIIVLQPASDAAAAEPVHDFLVWIRGAYRNTGIGRPTVEQELAYLRTKWKGQSHRLRVTLPLNELSGPGAKFVKAMWLTFFNHLDFHQVSLPARPKTTGPELSKEPEIVLERVLAGSADG